MGNYLYSFSGTNVGAVGVIMYKYNKYFLPGDKVKIRIDPQQGKLLTVFYFWDDGERTFAKVQFNHCCFKARVPKKAGNSPVLNVIVKVQCLDGTTYSSEHDFDINNIE